MAFNGQRELIMAAADGTVGTGAPATLTLTASEAGILDLSRLCITAGSDAGGGSTQWFDLASQLQLTSLTVQNSIELIRGRNVPAAPAGVWNAYRGISQGIPLGQWTLETGDTVAFAFDIDGTALSGNVCVAAPFLPRNSRGASPAIPTWSPVYTASPTAAVAAGAAGAQTTITFDEDGICDLTSLQMMATLQPAAAVNPDLDGSAGIAISSIALPSGDNVVIGQNAPRAGASMFAAGLRSYTWAALGAFNVSAGSTIVVTHDNTAVEILDVSAGMRFYPKNGPANRNRCSPC